MKTVAFIPARFASSRLPGKPLRTILGKTMIQHVYERVAAAGNLDAVYVATDDDRIREEVERFGGQVIMTPSDAASGTDRIASAADVLKLDDLDLIVNVQGDQPLVHPESVSAVISPFFENGFDYQFEMSTLSYRITDPEEIHNPKDVKLVTDSQGMALYFSRATIPYDRDSQSYIPFKHLGVYAYTRRFVEQFRQLPEGRLEKLEKLEQLRVLEHGLSIRVVESRWDSPEVDLPGDIERIESLLRSGS